MKWLRAGWGHTGSCCLPRLEGPGGVSAARGWVTLKCRGHDAPASGTLSLQSHTHLSPRKLSRDSVPRGFTGGWPGRHPLPGTCPNSRLREESRCLLLAQAVQTQPWAVAQTPTGKPNRLILSQLHLADGVTAVPRPAAVNRGTRPQARLRVFPRPSPRPLSLAGQRRNQ